MHYEGFELAEQLRVMEPSATQPRDLPGRYGRVIRDLERLLIAADTVGVVVGGWAVWHHGFAGRVTEDVDVVVARDKIDTLLQLSDLCGFNGFTLVPGRWPKLGHRETAIVVDVLPEAEFPGTTARPGLVAIGHPLRYRAGLEALSYCSLAGLIELKLGAGRTKDAADIIELIKRNPLEISKIADHLRQLHSEYATRFTALVELARTEA